MGGGGELGGCESLHGASRPSSGHTPTSLPTAGHGHGQRTTKRLSLPLQYPSPKVCSALSQMSERVQLQEHEAGGGNHLSPAGDRGPTCSLNCRVQTPPIFFTVQSTVFHSSAGWDASSGRVCTFTDTPAPRANELFLLPPSSPLSPPRPHQQSPTKAALMSKTLAKNNHSVCKALHLFGRVLMGHI